MDNKTQETGSATSHHHGAHKALYSYDARRTQNKQRKAAGRDLN